MTDAMVVDDAPDTTLAGTAVLLPDLKSAIRWVAKAGSESRFMTRALRAIGGFRKKLTPKLLATLVLNILPDGEFCLIRRTLGTKRYAQGVERGKRRLQRWLFWCVLTAFLYRLRQRTWKSTRN